MFEVAAYLVVCVIAAMVINHASRRVQHHALYRADRAKGYDNELLAVMHGNHCAECGGNEKGVFRPPSREESDLRSI